MEYSIQINIENEEEFVNCKMVDLGKAGIYVNSPAFECDIQKCPYGNLTNLGTCQVQGRIRASEKNLISVVD